MTKQITDNILKNLFLNLYQNEYYSSQKQENECITGCSTRVILEEANDNKQRPILVSVGFLIITEISGAALLKISSIRSRQKIMILPKQINILEHTFILYTKLVRYFSETLSFS